MPNQSSKLTVNGSSAIIWYALAVVFLIIDQWTKYIANTVLTFGEPVPVMPMLNWTLLYNYGAAFSFLADQSGWQKWFFSGLAFCVSIGLIVYIYKAPRIARLLSAGLALVLSGAIGNLIDRVRFGYVIDFIHVHYQNIWHYPAFNIADSAICVGVAFILIDAFFLEKKRTFN